MSETLAHWLRDRMAEHKMGRNELARRSGVAAATISGIWLRGHVPGAETLTRLADCFGVDRGTVLELAGLVKLSDLPQDLPPQIKDLARRLARLDEADRRAVLQSFDGILKVAERR